MPKLYIRVTGVDKLQANFNRLRLSTRQAIIQSLEDEAQLVLDRAKNEFVPVVTGRLRDSGRIEQHAVHLPGGKSRAVVAFGGQDAPYAVAVHENPRAGKTGGVSPQGRKYKTWSTVGQWKYLTHSMMSVVHTRAARVAAALNRHWRTSIK